MSATSSKRTTRRRNNFSVSKRKGITHEQKLTLYLNDDLAMENAAVQRLQSRIKQTKIYNAILILIQSLNEEKSVADWIKTNTPDILTQLWPEFESSVVGIENNGARLMNASPLIKLYQSANIFRNCRWKLIPFEGVSLCCFSPLHLYLNISIAKVFLSSSPCAYFFAAVVIVLLNSFVLPIDRPIF